MKHETKMLLFPRKQTTATVLKAKVALNCNGKVTFPTTHVTHGGCAHVHAHAHAHKQGSDFRLCIPHEQTINTAASPQSNKAPGSQKSPRQT